eukprot:1292530-Rhodomonas_salina.1
MGLMQAAQGLLKGGGFKGVYSCLGSAALGSAAGAALFFSTIEFSKSASSSTPSQQSANECSVMPGIVGRGEKRLSSCNRGQLSVTDDD